MSASQHARVIMDPREWEESELRDEEHRQHLQKWERFVPVVHDDTEIPHVPIVEALPDSPPRDADLPAALGHTVYQLLRRVWEREACACPGACLKHEVEEVALAAHRHWRENLP